MDAVAENSPFAAFHLQPARGPIVLPREAALRSLALNPMNQEGHVQEKASGEHQDPSDSNRMAQLEARTIELETAIEEAGILDLFEEPRMISMQLPHRPHPVACSFLQPPGSKGLIVLDLQIGALSSRALAIAGHTTMEEADIIGTTLFFGPPMSLAELTGDGCALPEAQREMLEEAYRQQEGRSDCLGRYPGKAPHEPSSEEYECMGFALQGILAAFRASSLSPNDVWESPRTILEIRVDGTTEGLSLGQKPNVAWSHIPFDPIEMAPFPSARLDRSFRRRPMHGKRAWILHMLPTHVSDATTRDTVQFLFALDASSGDIVGQGTASNGSADSIGRCMEEILDDVGYRPGTAITTSPRLDEILGEALQGLGIRYVQRKSLKASDPRIQDLEEFIRWAQPNMMAELMTEMGGL